MGDAEWRWGPDAEVGRPGPADRGRPGPGVGWRRGVAFLAGPPGSSSEASRGVALLACPQGSGRAMSTRVPAARPDAAHGTAAKSSPGSEWEVVVRLVLGRRVRPRWAHPSHHAHPPSASARESSADAVGSAKTDPEGRCAGKVPSTPSRNRPEPWATGSWVDARNKRTYVAHDEDPPCRRLLHPRQLDRWPPDRRKPAPGRRPPRRGPGVRVRRLRGVKARPH